MHTVLTEGTPEQLAAIELELAEAREMLAAEGVPLVEITYGEVPEGLRQLGPVGRPPATLQPGEEYVVTVFGTHMGVSSFEVS
jgi:hypothetical protein